MKDMVLDFIKCWIITYDRPAVRAKLVRVWRYAKAAWKDGGQ